MHHLSVKCDFIPNISDGDCAGSSALCKLTCASFHIIISIQTLSFLHWRWLCHGKASGQGRCSLYLRRFELTVLI